MPTVTYTWTFLSDAQGWSTYVGLDDTVSWTGADGDPATGCMQLEATDFNGNNASHSTNASTWENLGVPHGATVTHVDWSYFLKKVVHPVPIVGTDDVFRFAYGTAQEIALDTISESSFPTGSWQARSGSFNVTGPAQVSTYVTNFTIYVDLREFGGDSTGNTWRFDTVSLTITYSGGASVFTPRGVGGGVGRVAFANVTPVIFVNGGNPFHGVGGGIGRTSEASKLSEAIFAFYLAGAKNLDNFTMTNYGQPTPVVIDNPVAGQERWVDIVPVDQAGFQPGWMGDWKLRREGPQQTYSGGIVLRAISMRYKKKAQ